MDKFTSVAEYMAQVPETVLPLVESLRQTIREAVPEATEVISYNMPAYKTKSVLVYFAVYAKHIGFYPTGDGIAAFQDKIKDYPNSKGAIRFMLDKPLPLDLVREMTLYRALRVSEGFR
ncbi:MAG: DUF1801 domain-containing protein [Chitinophagales bacterium]|jgi:uncharacterized protein YdhG (YjbR/CyaY superfamily)|nr:DUF1801 domain-containing protein [Chitinophagales bacterium]